MKIQLKTIVAAALLSVFCMNSLQAQVAGERAEWMRGSWGLNWKPVFYTNHHVEKNMSIEPFLKQIQHLKTIDYIQIHLNESFIYSAAHTAPHDVLESLWRGNRDGDGNPRNLIVPRKKSGKDPFLDWLKAIERKKLRSMVYVNSGNLLWDAPDEIGNVRARFKNWCDTNPAAKAYLNQTNYRKSKAHPDREYMFCYARFILRDYSRRYGKLIDSWLFDTAHFMENNGDIGHSNRVNDQRLFQAFADAARAGNPDAAVSFNLGVGARTGPLTPFAAPTLYDDFTFGHPFGGAGDMTVPQVLYDYNFRITTWMSRYNGYAFRQDKDKRNDNIIAHFDPKMSTTAWNRGATPALTNKEFVRWNAEGLINGGAISWGAPLIRPFMNRDPGIIDLTMHDYAVQQLTAMDKHLQQNQNQKQNNNARQNQPAANTASNAGNNVARNGTARQSSTFRGADASRAIDGNTNGRWNNGSVSHTSGDESSAWWEVTLNSEESVDRIVIHNRTDNCCIDRLSGYVVMAWNADGGRTVRRVMSTSPNPSVTIPLKGQMISRVRITSFLPNTALNLAEVEVFAR